MDSPAYPTPDPRSSAEDRLSAQSLQSEWAEAANRQPEPERLSEEAVAASQPFVGQWNQLVSTTNWEKGRIVHTWRERLLGTEATATEYSDEAWARLVGGVTGQHVGRLRRVYARFGQEQEKYPGLYWSHFQAALDWDDAELWLEGAIQSKWSVAQMRRTRWEAHDAPPELKPREEDIISTELDEDFEPARNSDPQSEVVSSQFDQLNAPPTPEGPDFGDEDASFQADAPFAASEEYVEGAAAEAQQPASRPFAEIGALPDDVADAFEAFKLSIIRHRNTGWKELSQNEMLMVLDSLKELALAQGVESSAPF